MRDSKIHLLIKGKRKHIPVIFNKKVSDGKWHSIQLNKKKRKWLVTLDTNIKKPVRIPKITMRNEVYFGGYPQESDIFKKHFLVRIALNTIFLIQFRLFIIDSSNSTICWHL